MDLFLSMRKLWGVIVIVAGIIAGSFLWKKKNTSMPTAEDTEAHFTSKRISNETQNHTWWSFFQERPEATWVLVAAIALIFFGDVFQKYSFVFKASLLDLPQTEFTGTEMPVKKVPIWTELTEAERKMTYDQIPKSKFMDLPEYDIQAMRAGQEWQPDNAQERNIYVTYPVPNLGNYLLDGTENSGSHPGIDIKIPIGTPIHAIANGVVYKVQDKATGFGKAVSIAHVNIPDPNDQNRNVTLVSTYAHLSKIDVREGQTIRKGQSIGKSGDTGYATAPHIHFQIDRDDAPFIPYWPFTWNEAQNAGYSSTFEAVKAGFKKNEARKYTVHPVNFIAKFEGFSNEENLLVQSGTADNKIIKDEPIHSSAPEPVDQNNIELAETPPTFEEETTEKVEIPEEESLEDRKIIKDEAETTNLPDKITVEIVTDQNYIPGEKEVVKINVNAAELITDSISLTSTLKDRASVSPSVLTKDDFVNNVAEVAVVTESEYPFKVVAEGDFGEVKSGSLRPEVFEDVPATHTYADAIKFLRENEIVKGYEDGTYRPDNTLNRAEALKIILEANSIAANENSNNFPDVDSNAWFASYINTAFIKGIVKGYGDGQFRPGNTISRAEFLKMAILTAEFTPNENVINDPYPDVKSDLWYAPYFQFGRDNELLRMKKGGFIVPNDPINRGEAADVIYRLSKIIKQ